MKNYGAGAPNVHEDPKVRELAESRGKCGQCVGRGYYYARQGWVGHVCYVRCLACEGTGKARR